jgi:molybdopterin-guanine dinucleotide biosynthesis protein A
VTGVVLAGGRSSRFGSDKLAAIYRGAPILHLTVTRVAEVCGDVVVVLAPDAIEPRMPVGLAVRFVHDAAEREGPLAGAYAGLRAVTTEHALLAGGDMPDLQIPVLLELLRVAEDAPVDAVALAEGSGVQPLPSVVRAGPAREAAHALLLDGHRRSRDLLDGLRTAIVDEPTWHALDPERRTLFDVDEPSDLER